MLAPQCPAIRTGHTWLPELEVTYKLNPHVSELVLPVWQHCGELQSPLGHRVLQRILRTPHVGIVHVAVPRGT